jgi:hypothetical protein
MALNLLSGSDSRRYRVMKKLMSLMIGLTVALCSFAAFAQDPTTGTEQNPTDSTQKKKVKVKKNARKTVKKETSSTEQKQT